jgi:SAM-dependent methyltransferase
MIKRLRQEMARRGLTNFEAAVMDAQALAFPAGSFDCALCAFALHSFPHADRVLDEFRRVLAPEGRLGLTLSSRWWWEGDDRWTWHGELLEPLGAPIHPNPPRFTTTPEVEAALDDHGFEDVSVVEDTFPLVFGDFDEWWRWGWSHGYRRILESMGDEELQHYRESCAHELAKRTGRAIEGRLKVLLASARRA